MTKEKSSEFSARAFQMPDAVLDDIHTGKSSLSTIMKQHAGNLGDYDRIKAWEKDLRKRANWVGNTIPFHFVIDYLLKEQSGNPHVSQTLFEQEEQPVGYLKLCHLQRDTETRRQDCTKVEETLVDGTNHLKNLALFKAMYDFAISESQKRNHARVITELGIGLSPQKYRGLARMIHRLKAKSTRTTEEKENLAQASKTFNKDWMKATVHFVDAIDFEITDIVIPESLDTDSTPQIRISRAVPGASPLPLPAYAAPNRICLRCQDDSDLSHIAGALESYRKAAIEKYPNAAYG